MLNLPKNTTLGNYTIFNPSGSAYYVCFKENKTISDNLWEAAHPLDNSVPRYFMQICVLVFLMRLIIFLLKPLHQPRFIAEVLTGIILGPSVFNQADWLSGQNGLIPFEGALVMETLANFGLTLYMFMVGVEMDPTPLRKATKETLAVSVACLIFQLAAGLGLYKLLDEKTTGAGLTQGPAFWAIALTVTSFPDLARLLSRLKLLHTDLAKHVLTSAVISDIFTWAMLLVVVTINTGDSGMSPVKVVPILVFVVVFWFFIRPLIHWAIARVGSSKDNSAAAGARYTDEHVLYVLTALLLCALATELCGSHSMIGAFMLGLSIPNGELGTRIMDKIEEFTIGLALPPIFMLTGMRTNLRETFKFLELKMIITNVVLAFFIKIISNLLASLYFKKSLRESLVVGVLMNTKGILAIIVLNEGRNLRGFNQPVFGMVMLMILVMTALVGPIVRFAYKSSIRGHYFRRTLEKDKTGPELRVLVCVHSANHVNAMIGLLMHSNASHKSPITVFAVHLVELTGRAAAMLIFHDTDKSIFSADNDDGNNVSRQKAEADHVLTAFQSITRDKRSAISINLHTAVSPYPTMHEDIANFGLDKSVSIILVPFHKHVETDDTELTDQQLQQRKVTQHLLEVSPCSVGILIDRGTTCDHNSHVDLKRLNAIMFFIGGTDDREALAYARRISGAQGVMLHVVRFIPGNDVDDMIPTQNDRDGIFDAMLDWENEKQLDGDYINEFRFRTMYDQSVKYVEKTVNGCEDILSAIKSNHDGYDLYIVGRGCGFASPLTVGLSDFNEYPELGPLGETLISLGFISPASVLVIQQLPPSVSRIRQQHASANQAPASTGNVFVNHRKKYSDHLD